MFVKHIRSLFFDNLMLKFIALVIALLVWFYINSELTDDKTLRVKLDVVPPRGLSIGLRDVRSVEIRLRGRKDRIAELLQSEISSARLVLPENATTGENDFAIPEEIFRIPDGLKIRSINPKSIHVVLSKRISRDLRIEPNVQMPDGYYWKIVKVVPDVVKVEGPASVLEKKENVPAELINFRENSSLLDKLPAEGRTFTRKVKIVSEIGKAEIICNEDITVEVFVSRLATEIKREFNVPVSIFIKQEKPLYVADTIDAFVEIEVSGPAKRLEKLLISDFHAYAVIWNPAAGLATDIQVEVKSPEGVRVINSPRIDKIALLKVSAGEGKKTAPQKTGGGQVTEEKPKSTLPIHTDVKKPLVGKEVAPQTKPADKSPAIVIDQKSGAIVVPDSVIVDMGNIALKDFGIKADQKKIVGELKSMTLNDLVGRLAKEGVKMDDIVSMIKGLGEKGLIKAKITVLEK